MELSESSSGETAEQVRARARKPTPSAERAIWRGIPRRRPTSNPRTFSRRTRSRWPARIVEDAKHQSAELADIGIDVPPNKLAGRSPKQFRQLDAKGRFFYYGIDKEKKQLTNRVEQYVSLAGSEKAVPPAKSDLPFGLQTILEVGRRCPAVRGFAAGCDRIGRRRREQENARREVHAGEGPLRGGQADRSATLLIVLLQPGRESKRFRPTIRPGCPRPGVSPSGRAWRCGSGTRGGLR